MPVVAAGSAVQWGCWPVAAAAVVLRMHGGGGCSCGCAFTHVCVGPGMRNRTARCACMMFLWLAPLVAAARWMARAGLESAICLHARGGVLQPARQGSRLCSLYALCMSAPDSLCACSQLLTRFVQGSLHWGGDMSAPGHASVWLKGRNQPAPCNTPSVSVPKGINAFQRNF